MMRHEQNRWLSAIKHPTVYIILMSGIAITSATKWFESGSVQNILLSVGCSIIATAITSILNKVYNEKSENKQYLEIKQILSDQHLFRFPLYEEKHQLEKKGFYDNLYNNADRIHICGIALSSVIKYVCMPKKHSNHWVKGLETKRRVNVSIILSHPNAENVARLIESDPTNHNLRTKINESINVLRQFATEYNSSNSSRNRPKPLAEGSDICVYITKEPIHFCISSACNSNEQEKNIMLFGMALSKDKGPLYSITPNVRGDIYNELLNHVDRMIRRQDPLFVWNQKGIEFHEDPLQ